MHVFFALLVILLCLVNGWTDAPSAIAGCVCTRSMTPRGAIALAAVCNFSGATVMALVSPGVAKNLYGIADFKSGGELAVLSLCAALLSVVLWASAASFFGLPTSESHALISALTGAALASTKSADSIGSDEWLAVLMGLCLSTLPVVILSYVIYRFASRIFADQDRRGAMRYFKRVQFLGAGCGAFLHGAQDSQKFVGVYMLGLSFLYGTAPDGEFDIPLSSALLCGAAMALGTLLGGSKIIKKVGCEMTDLDVLGSSAADTASSAFLGVCSFLGLPTATTHAKTCAIMGVGIAKRSRTDPRVVLQIFLGWLLTFPACAALGFAFSLAAGFIFYNARCLCQSKIILIFSSSYLFSVRRRCICTAREREAGLCERFQDLRTRQT